MANELCRSCTLASAKPMPHTQECTRRHHAEMTQREWDEQQGNRGPSTRGESPRLQRTDDWRERYHRKFGRPVRGWSRKKL